MEIVRYYVHDQTMKEREWVELVRVEADIGLEVTEALVGTLRLGM